MDQIPPVSYKALTSDSPRAKNEALDNLATSMDPNHFGFFVLTETATALPLALRERYMSDTHDFFKLPIQTQGEYIVPKSFGQRGLTPYGVETGADAQFADPKSFLMFGADENGYPANPYFSQVPTLTGNALEVLRLGKIMSQVMYSALATVADVDPDIFTHYSGVVTNSSARAIEYSLDGSKLDLLLNSLEQEGDKQKVASSIRNDPSKIYRTFAHTDINLLTFVMRGLNSAGREGLEMVATNGVVPVVTENWHDLACNIGDLFQLITGWPSTVHQVSFGEGNRYAWPLFFHPPKGEGLPLLREEARDHYMDKFEQLYGGTPITQEMKSNGFSNKDIGNSILIDYDHALFLRLCEIKAIPEDEAKSFLEGIKTPKFKSKNNQS